MASKTPPGIAAFNSPEEFLRIVLHTNAPVFPPLVDDWQPPYSNRVMTGRLSSLFLFFVAPLTAADTGVLTFEEDVRPILKAQCFQCHGEEKDVEAGLDLRLVKLMAKGSKNGPVLSPGNSADSLFFQHAESGEMPPREEVRLSDEEVAVIGQWIDQGAKTAKPEPSVLPEPGELIITDAERDHWSFRPIVMPSEGEEVDFFLEQKLSEKGLGFSPSADARTLIRRAHFDLIGLPPTGHEVASFEEEFSVDPEAAFAALVDRLLESPHYGERWGRHWLDVAGYADSEGYNDKDFERVDAWRYRDYVIASLNKDKPWDQFIIEQLAGDELVKATHYNAADLVNESDDALEKLTATGFIRMAPDGTYNVTDDLEIAQKEVLTETVKIVSSSLLGLTVGCAECHHHRFDPISQEDFYRMRAIFAPVYNTEKWLGPRSRQIAKWAPGEKEKADELEAEAKVWGDKYLAEMERVVKVVFERELEKIPESKRDFARKAYETDPKERNEEQTLFLTEQYPAVNVKRTVLHLFLAKYEDGEELAKLYKEYNEKVTELRNAKPEPDYIRVAAEIPGRIPETRVFFRGDLNSPEGDPVSPGGVTVLAKQSNANLFPSDNKDLATSGRRLAYARYLTSGEHPLVARVLVNRFWMHHFGAGLVDTPGEFGSRSKGASHPELLDFLAARFMESGWSLKDFHRLVMNTEAYRQASVRTEEGEAVDPGNRLLWRMPVRRLEAETLRDAILSVNGRLKTELFGEPLVVKEDDGGLFSVAGGEVSEDGKELRRSIYIQQRRSQPVTMLEAFDAPQMEPNCELRQSSTVATQSLAMMNSAFILRETTEFAKHVIEKVGGQEDSAALAREAWRSAFATDPSAERQSQLVAFLDSQEAVFEKEEDFKQKALATLCQVLLETNAFLYID